MARKKTEEQTVTQEVAETGYTVDYVDVHEVVKDSDEPDITEDDATEDGQHEGKEKVKLISLTQLEQALIELGVDIATGIKERTRNVTSQETESINALCNIYNTLLFKK